MDPKALEMMIYVTPKIVGHSASILADFKLLWSPFRVKGCRLVQTAQGYTVYFPDRSIKVTQQGMEAIVTAAAGEFERATGRGSRLAAHFV